MIFKSVNLLRAKLYTNLMLNRSHTVASRNFWDFFIAAIAYKNKEISGRLYVAKKGALLLGLIHQSVMGI